MNDSQLMDTFRGISASELSELRLFVKSPFFNRSNRSEAVIQLFEYLTAAAPDFDASVLNREAINASIFATLPYVEGRLEKTMTELLKVIRLYIAHRHSDCGEGSVNYQLAMAKFYRDNGMENRFLTAVEKLRKELSALDRPNIRQLYQSFLTEELLHDHLIVYYSKKDDANLIATIRHFDRYYLSQRMTFTAVFNNISHITRLDQSAILPVTDLFEKIIRDDLFPDIPLIKGYYHACQILTLPFPDSDAHFHELRLLTESNSERIPQEHLFNLGSILRNHCVLQMNAGRNEYQDIYLSLFKSQLEKGVLYHQGGILVSILQNMIQTGLRAGELTWVRDILESHKDRITGSHSPQEVYHYNLANYYFHNKEYDKALDLLTYQYEDIWYLIRARNLEIKAYYELKEWDMVDVRLESYKVYLIRLSKKHLPEPVKEAYMNFVNYMKRLMYANGIKRRVHTQRLLEYVRAAENTVDKEWLLQKLEALL